MQVPYTLRRNLLPTWLKALTMTGILVFSLTACKKKLPDGVLDQGKLQEVLYDYHMAQALAQTHHDSLAYYEWYYTEMVWQKHHLTEQEFQTTMAYYARNAELLAKVYAKLDEQLAEATAGGVHETNIYERMTTAAGDTLNFWPGKSFYVLSPETGGRMEFQVAADTIAHSGDQIMWEFEPRWIYREGAKEAVAVLALHYEGDSVLTQYVNIYGSGRQSIRMTAGELPLRSISGFIYQQGKRDGGSVKLLLIQSPVLVRFRNKAHPITSPTEGDSTIHEAGNAPTDLRTPEQRIRDSLLRLDTLQRKRRVM